ncbi:MAG TPA: glycoside hydrolase family 88 protein [Phycisphaerae bacterium]|jgi:rhamnogalacturonyl hydrolase YesR
MGYYFEDHLSMHAAGGALPASVQHTLETIVRRYVGNNPSNPMTYRAYSKKGILRGKDYRYEADFSKIFPDARPEQYVYAWAKYWSDTPATFMADVSCLSPMTVMLNGAVIFKPDIFSERYPDKRNRITLPLAAGWNHFLIRSKKTAGGFGWVFGTWLGKHPYYFVMPTPEREGGGGQQEGWIFTQPLDAELIHLPMATGQPMSEADFSGVNWLPENTWKKAQEKNGQLQRIFGSVPGSHAFAWTTVTFLEPHQGRYFLQGRHAGRIVVTIGEQEVFVRDGAGVINTAISVPYGRHDVMVKVDCPKKGRWGFDLTIEDPAGKAVQWQSPCSLVGSDDPWIYIGTFPAQSKITPAQLRDLNRVHPAIGGETYWRVDMPGGWVRAYNENTLFGRWNYPLGVTLYGMLHSAKVIGSPETEQYILRHMQSCCDTFDYALWDKNQYGGATAMHTLLSSIDSLDDCGSFGSAMLEVAAHHPLQGFRKIADYVADYIINKQARLEDGTFYRKILMHIFHENTMWADDLYMCVPFLCRYATLTGDRKYLDEAARQFLGFKKRLYMPELKIMSHIYDFRRDMKTGVPWGRGNGWVIFSLSELLGVLPENHASRGELLAFFRQLCEGYLALQDEAGMWHQVLTHPDAYPETSCTAMFAYAFARAVRHGWLKTPDPYARAVIKAWEALNRISIDRAGNVHGVCRGSEFSFSPEYYKKELLPNLNDTHGIGIVLLAGVEVLRMQKFLEQKVPAKSQPPRRASRTLP